MQDSQPGQRKSLKAKAASAKPAFAGLHHALASRLGCKCIGHTKNIHKEKVTIQPSIVISTSGSEEKSAP